MSDPFANLPRGDGVHSRIERLVAGPYLELFARAPRENWTVWGNQTDKFAEAAE